uniref:Uncharacterized protein n=1 Tax=Trichogramma kaykai TaxID=54128 RepID=A0ABD2VWW0_9HYME
MEITNAPRAFDIDAPLSCSSSKWSCPESRMSRSVQKTKDESASLQNDEEQQQQQQQQQRSSGMGTCSLVVVGRAFFPRLF